MLATSLKTIGRRWLRRQLLLSREAFFPSYVQLERRHKCNNVENAITMWEVKKQMMLQMGVDGRFSLNPKSREGLLQHTPKLEDLPPRSMQDSFTAAIVPLSKDPALQDAYVSYVESVRIGRLLEDMDLFAVWVCLQHLHTPKRPKDVPLPYTIVTVLVDEMAFTDIFTDIKKDIRLSGHVTWVGRTSLEVIVWLEVVDGDCFKKLTRAYFLLAARNATNTSSVPVNPLSPANDKEKKLLAAAEERKQRRSKVQKQSTFFNLMPNEEEQKLMYELYHRTTDENTMELNKRFLPPNCRWMSDWKVEATVPAFPENRNLQNTIFGGFLMRLALESSWLASSLYFGKRPRIKHIADVNFHNPLQVNSFIKTSSYPVYAERKFLQLITVIDVVDNITKSQKTSNSYLSIYMAPHDIPEVQPRSYHETVWYIYGRRKFMHAMKVRQALKLDKQEHSEDTK